jgi:hypothetical protein
VPGIQVVVMNLDGLLFSILNRLKTVEIGRTVVPKAGPNVRNSGTCLERRYRFCIRLAGVFRSLFMKEFRFRCCPAMRFRE